MLVLKGDESWIDIDGNPYDSSFKNNIDKFCEQYLNDKSTFFEEEKAFFYTEIKHQWHKSVGNLFSAPLEIRNKGLTASCVL